MAETEDILDSDEDDEAPVLIQVPDQKAAVSPADNLEPSQPSSSTQDVPVPPCPVTILSGFLGAGKTTLIQYILKSPDHGKRIAVIENEYGEGLAIESLIARDGVDSSSSSSALADLVELPNGCLCCTVKDSLVTTLEALLDKQQRQEHPLDYILIECSGLANPGPIAATFWLDEALDSRLRLDGIVTLCDAVHLEHQLRDTTEAAQQIAYADRILLNKVDLLVDDESGKEAKEHRMHHLTDLIRQFHPTAPIRPTSHAAIPDLEWILDASCFDGQKFLHQEQEQTQPEEHLHHHDYNHDHSHDHSHDHNHDHNHDNGDTDCSICQQQQQQLQHSHTSGISTISLVKTGSVDRRRIDRWLASILWPNQDQDNKVLSAWLEQQRDGAETEFHAPCVMRPNDSSQEEVPQPQQSVFRIKGILSVWHTSPDSPDYASDWAAKTTTNTGTHTDKDGGCLDQRRFIVQAVHDLWEIYPAALHQNWVSSRHSNNSGERGEERCCKIVVIGRHLDPDQLKEGFEACFVSDQ